MTGASDVVRVRPERFVAGGEALARDTDGRVVFARGAIPGEEVTVALTDRKRDWARGVTIEVRSSSSDRVVPPCPHRRAGCGGCDWQHLAVPAQLTAKVGVVVEALRRTGRLHDPVVRAGAAVPERGHRTTVRVVGDADRRAAYRVERSHDTVPAAGCLVAHPALVEVLDRIAMDPGLEVTLRVSAATGAMTARWDVRRGDVTGLPTWAATGGRAHLVEEVAGHRFRVSADSFFQSGPAAAELLVGAVERAAPELATADTVLDAYAGVGLLALAATSPQAKLITVETSKSAVADCRVNLAGREARIERVEVGDWRPDHRDRIGVVLADPARTGLGRPGVAAVTATGAPVLVLVSCDPVALARDAALLAADGYRHAASEVLDLFPHTHHVEAVTRFVRD